MDSESTWLIVFAALALAGVVVTALAETALSSLSRARIQHLIEQGNTRVRPLERFVEHPGGFLQGTHSLRVLASVGLAGATAAYATRHVGSALVAAVIVVAIVALTVLTLGAFARTVAASRAEGVALALAPLIRAWTFVARPFTRAVNALAAAVAGGSGRALADGPIWSTDELRTLVMVGEEERLIEESEREMIDSIFDLEQTTVRELMVPRLDVVAVSADTCVGDAIDLIVGRGYSRLPVFEDSIDNVVGVLYAKDLFRQVKENDLLKPVRALARPAFFVPESKKVDELLRELQLRRVHIAIAVDEYGGTAGLITIEDLLEEIVGEIQDEYDREEAKIVEVGAGEAIFDANVSIHDVNDTLSLHLEGEDVDTVGGLVYENLGKLPSPGDQVQLDGATLTVLSTTGRRIRKVRVVSRSPIPEDVSRAS